MATELYYYALRITPYPNTEAKVKTCRGLLEGFIHSIAGENYVFGQEYEKNHHFHIVFSHKLEFDPQKDSPFMDEFKASLYETFDVPKNKKGNPTYSMEPVRSLDEALSYAVKEGDYDCSEQWAEIIREAYENSYTKKHSLKSSLADLTDKYMKDEISDKDLWIGLGQSRADLGIPLSIRWIDEMTLSIQCKKDPSKLATLWEEKKDKEELAYVRKNN